MAQSVARPVNGPRPRPPGKPNRRRGLRRQRRRRRVEDVTTYNNFYEFTTDKDGVADAAAGFDARDWKVSVEGAGGQAAGI